MQIYLVRHPPPLIDTGVCYGSSDLACAPHAQAAVLTELLTRLPLPLSGVPVYSSPLRRCAELARALPGAEVTLDARLMEMHFGAWELQRWDDVPRAEVNAWRDDLHRYRPGGGESLLQLTARVHAFYRDLLARRAPQAVVVCHSGSMRVLAACAPDRSLARIAAMAVAAASPAYGDVIRWQPADS